MRWLKRILTAIVSLLAAYGAWSLWPRAGAPMAVYHLSDFSAGPEGIVGFPSWNAATGRAFQAGPEFAEPVNGGGLLVLPPDASAANPVPAVVILHGSGGDWSGRSVRLANRLARAGIAGFAVNTFVARDLKASDDYFTRLRKASIYSQISDGLNALGALQDHPAIDTERIAVTGFSLGAASALYSMFEPVASAVLGVDGPRFSAYAAFYAGCSFDFEDFRPEGSPVLLMIGARDESMSVERCEWLRDKLLAHGVATELKVYPDAAHGWDQPFPMRFDAEAAVTRDCIMLWTRSGENVETTTGHVIDSPLGALRAFSRCASKGYSNGSHPPTAEQSWRDFHAFLLHAWGLDAGD